MRGEGRGKGLQQQVRQPGPELRPDRQQAGLELQVSHLHWPLAQLLIGSIFAQ